MWIDEYTEFRIGGIPNPEEVSSSGHGECYGACQDSWEYVCRNGPEVLSWLDVLFQTGIMFPTATIIRNDQ
jgi:hypothetical protein